MGISRIDSIPEFQAETGACLQRLGREIGRSIQSKMTHISVILRVLERASTLKPRGNSNTQSTKMWKR